MCLMPFTNITVNPDGTVVPCCKYNLNRSDLEITQRTLYEYNIQELFDQPAMKKLRQKFNNGEQPSGCEICWNEEASGVTSMRNHRAMSINQKIWNHDELINNPSIISMDLKFSSLCNLKCRICNPYCSSNWLKEAQDTGTNEHTIKIFSKHAERKFVNNEENFKIFKKIVPNIRILEFYGGEPFMQPEHAKIIKILDEYYTTYTGKKNIHLMYNTNGTMYDQSVVDIFNKFDLTDNEKQEILLQEKIDKKNQIVKRSTNSLVSINFSIDDIGDRFEYQRYPAKWSDVSKNIVKYKENTKTTIIAEKEFGVQLCLYTTVSLYNIFYLDELVKYNNENFKLPFRWNVLHWPDHQSIRHLPLSLKIEVKDKLSKLKEYEIDYHGYSIKHLVDFMMSNEADPLQLKMFLEKNTVHDDYRGQSFKETFPEYYDRLIS